MAVSDAQTYTYMASSWLRGLWVVPAQMPLWRKGYRMNWFGPIFCVIAGVFSMIAGNFDIGVIWLMLATLDARISLGEK